MKTMLLLRIQTRYTSLLTGWLINCLEMAREVIADKGIWTAKKRYILNVHDSEGVRYKEPKLKIMGIEAVKSSTPKVCRNKIKEALKIIINEDSKVLNTFIQDFRSDFMRLDPEEIAYPRSVNGLEKFSSSNGMFSFITFFPKELDLLDRIDYDTQFTKSFVEPLKFISEKIDWWIDDSYGTQGTLDGFF